MNLHLFIGLLFLPVASSATCSVFLSLNCSCFQSNVDVHSSTTRPIYSHLYCQGHSLNQSTLQAPFGADFERLNQFRTVSLEFVSRGEMDVHPNQFDGLAMLFAETETNTSVDIYLRLTGFSRITFHKRSLTAAMFHEKHQTRRLWIHLIPKRNQSLEMENEEKNSSHALDQFVFASDCFTGLTVAQLSLYIYTPEDRFPSSSFFEQIFNGTNLDELHFHGSIIPPSPSYIDRPFKGFVKSLTLYRHVHHIDAHAFPFYPHVYSFTIHSIDGHSMNLSSFLPSHSNLRGLELIKPLFEVFINHFIPSLERVTLDIEHLTDKTLLAARHIRQLKLGSSLRTTHPQFFSSLSRRLTSLDLSAVDLSQMTIDSRCQLLTYLSSNARGTLTIVFPRTENITECNCQRLFLGDLHPQPQPKTDIELTCAKLCAFSDCPIVGEHFKEKYRSVVVDEDHPSSLMEATIEDEKNVTVEHFAAVDLFADSVDVDMLNFLINQTSEHELNETRRRSSTTTITTPIDMHNISVIEDIQEYDEKIDRDLPSRHSFFSWLSFFVGVTVVFLLLVLGGLIVFFIVQYRKRHNIKPVPVYL